MKNVFFIILFCLMSTSVHADYLSKNGNGEWVLWSTSQTMSVDYETNVITIAHSRLYPTSQKCIAYSGSFLLSFHIWAESKCPNNGLVQKIWFEDVNRNIVDLDDIPNGAYLNYTLTYYTGPAQTSKSYSVVEKKRPPVEPRDK